MKKSVYYVWLAALIGFTAIALMLNARSLRKEGGETHPNKIDALALEQIVMNADQNGSGKNRIQAPPFTLKTLEGNSVSVGGVSGKPMLIHFWASWCEACQAEAPDLKRLYEEFKDKVSFYGINVSSEEKSTDDIAKFMRDNELSYPTLLDDNKRAAYLYELHALPTTFLIDAEGKVADTFHLADPLELEEKLERLSN